ARYRAMHGCGQIVQSFEVVHEAGVFRGRCSCPSYAGRPNWHWTCCDLGPAEGGYWREVGRPCCAWGANRPSVREGGIADNGGFDNRAFVVSTLHGYVPHRSMLACI